MHHSADKGGKQGAMARAGAVAVEWELMGIARREDGESLQGRDRAADRIRRTFDNLMRIIGDGTWCSEGQDMTTLMR